jgi:hypothetical protein
MIMSSSTQITFLFVLVVVVVLSITTVVVGFSPTIHSNARYSGLTTSSSASSTSSLCSSTTTATKTVGTAPYLKSALKKPSKVLTVGVEITTSNNVLDGEDDNSSSLLWNDPNELSILSMQLRKSKVAAIWVSADFDSSTTSAYINNNILKVLVDEQATAKGNFPGPVPIIYNGPILQDDLLSELTNIGVSAVVVDASQMQKIILQKQEMENNVEIIWKVSSVSQVKDVLEKTENQADAFLLDTLIDDEFSEIAAAIPSSCLQILAVDAMQPDGMEVDQVKKARADWGCSSALVRDACVGDTEDLEYAQFVVNGMTSKASSEFKFSGLTGSTNGHFGGIQQNQQIKWRRRNKA